MREGKYWLRLFVLGLLACTLALAGCDDGDDGDDGPAGPPGPPGEDFQLPQGEYVGLFNCSTCHGNGSAAQDWLDSAHANQGSHTLDGCATECHNPQGDSHDMASAFGVTPTGYVVGCEACHGPGSSHQGVGEIPNPAPRTEVCAECHSTLPESHIPHHPLADEIAERFATSRHANQHARTGFCSACHSHEGGVALLEMGRMTSIDDLVEAYNSATVEVYELPEAAETEDGIGVTVKTCSTCHDSHSGELRGDGDVETTVVWDDDNDPDTAEVEETATVYSAEFNLCTACHMVDLEPTPAGHGDEGLLFEYELSDKYLKENLVDATTGTWKEVDIDGQGPTKVTNVFYHDGTSANNRHFVDTHFGGTLYSSLYYIGDADTQFDNIEIQGYNINAAAENACTICHDPHTGNKMLSPDEEENNDNSAISYAEGIGEFHTDYLGDAMGHGCTPCHDGNDIVTLTVGGESAGGSTTAPIGCRSCHDLAVANAEPAVNNAEALAEVRTFPADYEFAFDSGVVVENPADLGVNRICFECHKGRTAAPTAAEEAALPAGETEIRTFAYLHYAPSYAILFGNDSAMVPVYEGKTYAGQFTHYDGVKFGCVDCHNVHDTDGNNVVENKMQNPAFDCNGCHQSGAFVDAAVLKKRTEDYGWRLLETLLDEVLPFATDTTLSADLQTFIADLAAETDVNVQLEMLDLWIHGRTNTLPTKAIAKAADIYKIFNYEDGSPHGVTHGHGGSWAHNSRFARQVMYDAIEALGGDLTGLGRP